MAMHSPASTRHAQKNVPSRSRRKPARRSKRKRGGQPGNQNARKQGIFSAHHPSALGQLHAQLKDLQKRLNQASSSSSVEQILSDTETLWSDIENLEMQNGKTLETDKLALKLVALSAAAKARYLPAVLRQRILTDLAHDPFAWFEADYRHQGIIRDADSFLFVSKNTAQNSSISLFSPRQIRSNLELNATYTSPLQLRSNLELDATYISPLQLRSNLE